MVVKKDGSRELFERTKLLNGLLRACEKRPVSLDEIEKAVDMIETELQNSLDREVTSVHIGELAMDKLKRAVDSIEQTILNSMEREVTSTEIGTLAMEELKKIDDVAYVRFASVYREFKDITSFMDELKTLLTRED